MCPHISCYISDELAMAINDKIGLDLKIQMDKTMALLKSNINYEICISLFQLMLKSILN